MLKAITRGASLRKTPLTRSLPAFSTSSFKLANDPSCINEAPLIDADDILNAEKKQHLTAVDTCKVPVPARVDLTPISGVPYEHIYTRTVRIYQPPKNVMQSGTNNINHWEIEFDNRQRWENPLMGWTSSGDPLSNMKVEFPSPCEAIEHCEKNGWHYYIDVPRTERPLRPKSYGVNFSWNKRTRVSTK